MDINSFTGPIVSYRIFVDYASKNQCCLFGLGNQEWQEMEPCGTLESAQKEVESWIKDGYNRVRVQIEVG